MQSSGISSPETGRTRPFPSPTTLTRKRYALTGRSHSFDPRIDAARGDLADLRLAERIFAPHYAVASARTAIAQTPLLETPRGIAVSEVLLGEDFDVLEVSDGHAWGVSPVDGAVGFVATEALGAPVVASQFVCVRSANGLPMGTRLPDPAGFAPDAIRALDAPVSDFVALAEALDSVPYLAGGRSGAGVDDAGLIFLTLSLAGVRAPRFLSLQAELLGHAVESGAPVLRGDLFYSGDHAAIAANEDELIAVVDGVVGRITLYAFDPAATRRRLP